MTTATRISENSSWSFLRRWNDEALQKSYERISDNKDEIRRKEAQLVFKEISSSPENANVTADLIFAAIPEINLEDPELRSSLIHLINMNEVFRNEFINVVLTDSNTQQLNANMTNYQVILDLQTPVTAVSRIANKGIQKLWREFIRNPSFAFQLIVSAPKLASTLTAKRLYQWALSNSGVAMAVFLDSMLSAKISAEISAQDIAYLFSRAPEGEKWKHYLPRSLAFILQYCPEHFVEFWNNSQGTINEHEEAKQKIVKILYESQHIRPDIAEIIQKYPRALLVLAENNMNNFLKLIQHSTKPLWFLSIALEQDRSQSKGELSDFVKENIVEFLLGFKSILKEKINNLEEVETILGEVLKLKLKSGESIKAILRGHTVSALQVFTRSTSQEDPKKVDDPAAFSHMKTVVSVLNDHYLRTKIKLNDAQKSQWQGGVSKFYHSYFSSKNSDPEPCIYYAKHKVLWELSIKTDEINDRYKQASPYMSAHDEIYRERKNLCSYFHRTYLGSVKPSKEFCEIVQNNDELMGQFKQKPWISWFLSLFGLELETDIEKLNTQSLQLIQSVLDRSQKTPDPSTPVALLLPKLEVSPEKPNSSNTLSTATPDASNGYADMPQQNSTPDTPNGYADMPQQSSTPGTPNGYTSMPQQSSTPGTPNGYTPMPQQNPKTPDSTGNTDSFFEIQFILSGKLEYSPELMSDTDSTITELPESPTTSTPNPSPSTLNGAAMLIGQNSSRRLNRESIEDILPPRKLSEEFEKHANESQTITDDDPELEKACSGKFM